MGPTFFICGLIFDHISSASVVEEFPLQSQDVLTSDICYFNLWSPSASQLTFNKMSLAGLMCRACLGKTCTNSDGFGQFAHTAGFKVSRPALSQPRSIPAGTVRWQNQDPTNWE